MVKIKGIWSEVTLKWSAKRVKAKYKPEIKAKLKILLLLYIKKLISDINKK
jgi:hypothetical protein